MAQPLDLSQIAAQANAQQKVEAGVRQFIGETAQGLFAVAVSDINILNATYSLNEQDHKKLKSLAAKCTQIAPYLAEAIGLPVQVTYTKVEKEDEIQK